MKRGAQCRYGALIACEHPAVRTVAQKPYCEKHATIVERIHRNVEENQLLLQRLAER